MKPTILDVAAKAGVSTATVSRVINNSGYVSERSRKLVADAIEELRFRPNAIARSLKQDSSRAVGYVVPDLANGYFMRIARTLQRLLLAEGYHLLMMDTEEDVRQERQALDMLTGKQIEAVVLAGTGGNRDTVQAMRELGIHVVLLDRLIDGLDIDLVAGDNTAPACDAVVRLLRGGHRRIGFVGGRLSVSTAEERKQGVLEAFRREGVDPGCLCMFEGDFTRESGREAARYFLSRAEPPTAIFSANNEMTFGLYLGWQEAGGSGQQPDIVSFGDLDFFPLLPQRPGVIRQQPDATGRQLAELLLRGIAQPDKAVEKRLIAPEWIPGDAARRTASP